MTLTETELRSIVGRATPLAEVLASSRNAPPAVVTEPARVTEARSARWKRTTAAGNDAQFARRLAWDDVPASYAGCVIAPTHADGALPTWATLVREWSTAVREATAATARDEHEKLVPFVELLMPLVIVARKQLEQRAPAAARLLSADALAQLERGLCSRLSDLCRPTLLVEFSAFCSARKACLGSAAAPTPSDATDDLYQTFIARSRNGLGALLGRYPVLARLAAITTEAWADSIAEMIDRLGTDRDLLSRTFANGDSLGEVASVEYGLSDPHRGGRTVAILRFATGTRVVYKPRSLALDRSFYSLIAWLNAGGVTVPLLTPAILDRVTHGWMEFLEWAPCADMVEVEQFYQRAGMLTCLAYLLGGADLHYQNVLACGSHPVLLDLEVLVSTPVEGVSDALEGARGDDIRDGYWDSVVRTQLMPMWCRGPDGVDRVDGGFAVPQVSGARVVRRIRNVNTDAMRMGDEPVSSVAAVRNVPTCNGQPVDGRAYVESIVDGFEDMYRALLRGRRELLRAGGWIARLAPQHTRCVLRDTATYASVLTRALHPSFLASGIDRSIELESLARGLVKKQRRPALWDAFRAEMADLERGDVPIFTARIADGTISSSTNARVGELRARAGDADIRRRISGMSIADLERQVTLIRNCYRLIDLRSTRVVGARPTAPLDSADPARPAGLTREQALDSAHEIYRELRRLVARTASGEPVWVTIAPNGRRGESFLGYTGASLGQGSSGIALFLAALYHVTGRPEYGDFAHRVAAPLLRRLGRKRECEKLARQLGIGGSLGMGGVVYALTRAAELLDAPEFLTGAAQAAAAITPAGIASDKEYDVHVGAAGALLGLLAFYRRSGNEQALDSAVIAGRHLIAACTPQGAWLPTTGVQTTGFAHGTSGIAHALSALHSVTGNDDLHRVTQMSRAFERAVFLPELGNWRECATASAEEDTADGLWCSWCHGAAGIGLSRAARFAFGTMDDADRAELAVAAETTRDALLHGVDTVCCGNMGRVELLLCAAAALDRSDVRADALSLAGVVRQRSLRGCFTTSNDSLPDPGFLQGVAGIGYTLLRCIEGNRLPCAITFG